MKMRLMSLTVIVVLLSVIVLAPMGAKAEAQTYQVKNDLKNIPVAGSLASGGTFDGKLTLLGLTVGDAGLLVTGVLDGIATSSTGTVTRVKDQTFTTAVNAFQQGPAAPGVCDIFPWTSALSSWTSWGERLTCPRSS